MAEFDAVLALLVSLAIQVPELPAECQAPSTRDVSALTAFAHSSGSLSVGLDSVATWCFSAEGSWTGGQTAAKGKKPSPSANPVGDCAKAISSCEAARAAVSAEARQLLSDALADLERPFLGMKYRPKRSGLDQRPSELAQCSSKERLALYSQAQACMDLARLASQVHSEYGNYKTWLFGQGLKCEQAVAQGKKDLLRKGVAIDNPVQSSEQSQQLPSAKSSSQGSQAAAPPALSRKQATPRTPATTEAAAEVAPTKGAMSDRANLAEVSSEPSTPQAPQEPKSPEVLLSGPTTASPEKSAGASTASSPTPRKPEAAEVSSPAPPTAMVSPAPSAAPPSEGVTLGGPTAAREKALASSMVEKWRYFLSEQTKIQGDFDWVAGFLASRELRGCRCAPPHPVEVVRRLESKDRVAQLEADDEKNTRCELCLLDEYPKWKLRSQKQCALALELSEFELGVLQRSDDGNGLPPRCVEAAQKLHSGSASRSAQAGPPQGTNAFIITKSPPVASAPPSSSGSNEFVKAQDYAPMPAREEGRVYLRIFTSAACVAEVLPGPIQARTGDLLPLSPVTREITVQGPCGGLAEIYFGREEKPRVAETFARHQPLRLQLRPP